MNSLYGDLLSASVAQQQQLALFTCIDSTDENLMIQTAAPRAAHHAKFMMLIAELCSIAGRRFLRRGPSRRRPLLPARRKTPRVRT
jgi:hypothetical protein